MLVSLSQGSRELGVSIEHARRQVRAGKWIKGVTRLVTHAERELQEIK